MSDEQVELNWKEHIPEDIRTEKFFSSYPDSAEGLENILKTSLHSHRRIGENPIKRLTEDSTDEERSAFFNELGAKEKPEEYLFEKSEHLSEEQVKEIQDLSFANHLSMDQAKALFEHSATKVAEAAEAAKKEVEVGRETLVNRLKDEYGDKYSSAETKIANTVKYLGEDFQDVMETPIGNNYDVVKALIKVGELLQEDSVEATTGFSFIGKTDLETAERKLDKLKRDPEFQKRLLTDKDPVAKQEWMNAVMSVSELKNA